MTQKTAVDKVLGEIEKASTCSMCDLAFIRELSQRETIMYLESEIRRRIQSELKWKWRMYAVLALAGVALMALAGHVK